MVTKRQGSSQRPDVPGGWPTSVLDTTMCSVLCAAYNAQQQTVDQEKLSNNQFGSETKDLIIGAADGLGSHRPQCLNVQRRLRVH